MPKKTKSKRKVTPKKRVRKVEPALVKVAKAQTRRNRAPFPALEPRLNLKTRYDLVDYDYVDKLSDKEKAWLNSFTEEYVHANMKHDGKKLHKTKKLRKDCYDRNNARNRCILTKSKACGMTVSIDELEKDDSLEMEDQIIENLDEDLFNK